LFSGSAERSYGRLLASHGLRQPYSHWPQSFQLLVNVNVEVKKEPTQSLALDQERGTVRTRTERYLSFFRKDWQHVATAELAEMRKGLMQQVMDTGESGFRFSLGLTCNIYVVMFETSNLELSIPLVLFDLATALSAITLQISVTIPINRLKRCRFAVTLPSVACSNA